MVEKSNNNKMIDMDRFKATRQVPGQGEMEQKLRKAADMYEQQFLGDMLKSMRSTVSESELLPSGIGQKIYEGELDNEYVKAWVGRGGIGLSDLIYNQLHEKMFPQKMMRPLGPLPLENTKNFKMQELETENEKQKTFKIDIQSAKPDPKQPNANSNISALQSPWEGKVLHIGQNEHGISTALVAHDKNLQTSYSFQGIARTKVGDSLQAGQKIADMSTQSPLYFSIKS